MRRLAVLASCIAMFIATVAPVQAGDGTELVPVSAVSYQVDHWDYTSHYGGNVFHQNFTALHRVFGDEMLQGWMYIDIHTVENYSLGVSHRDVAFTLFVDDHPDSGWWGTGRTTGTVTPGTYHPFVDDGTLIGHGFGEFNGMELRLSSHAATDTYGRTDYEGEVLTGPAGAAPSGLHGRFVGIDVEKPVGSYWEVTFAPSGRWNGIDSATNVCAGFLSRTFGEFWEADTPNAFGATINVKCLEGPNEGMVFNLGEFSKPLIYDPVEDTVLQDTNAWPPNRDVTFCRIPCDPYEYYGGPW